MGVHAGMGGWVWVCMWVWDVGMGVWECGGWMGRCVCVYVCVGNVYVCAMHV